MGNVYTKQFANNFLARHPLIKWSAVALLICAGAAWLTYYEVHIAPALHQQTADASCAVKSLDAATVHTPAGIACRDRYREDTVITLDNDFRAWNYETVTNRRERGFSSFPQQVLQQAAGPDASWDAGFVHALVVSEGGKTYTLRVGADDLCLDIIIPVHTVSGKNCAYTFPSSGALQSDPLHTAYFYIPFMGSNAAAGSSNATIDGYVIGACEETGHLYVRATNAALYRQVNGGSIVTTGAQQLAVTCTPSA